MTGQVDTIISALKLYGSERPLCVADIGSQSCWLHACAPHPKNLYLSGPMGLASSVALGVAITRPSERVLAICGDGSLSMNFSSLITIRHANPNNLCLLVIANDTYEFTGALPSPSSSLDWVSVGSSIFGDSQCKLIQDASPDFLANSNSPLMIVAQVMPSSDTPPALGLSPVEIRNVFLQAISTL